MTERQAIVVPHHAIRALHSGLVDWITAVPEEHRDSMLTRLGGLDFLHFRLALLSGSLVITTKLDPEDNVMLGVAVPVEGHGRDWPLFELPPSHTSVAARWLIDYDTVTMDEELAALLGGGS